MGRTAAFFDLDRTLVATSATLALVGPLRAAGLVSRRTMVRAAWARSRYLRIGADADFMAKVKRATAARVIGLPADRVRAIAAAEVDRLILPSVYPAAAELLSDHRAQGHDLVLVSSSGVEIVEPIAAALGIPRVIATRMRIADGRYTGEFEYFAYADEKAAGVRRLASDADYELTSSYAYTDSITDAPLLRCVGHPVAVNPDRRLRALAVDAGWPIRDFAPPAPRGRRG